MNIIYECIWMNEMNIFHVIFQYIKYLNNLPKKYRWKNKMKIKLLNTVNYEIKLSMVNQAKSFKQHKF